MMRYITLCSGIECVSVAAAGMGWTMRAKRRKERMEDEEHA